MSQVESLSDSQLGEELMAGMRRAEKLFRQPGSAKLSQSAYNSFEKGLKYLQKGSRPFAEKYYRQGLRYYEKAKAGVRDDYRSLKRSEKE